MTLLFGTLILWNGIPTKIPNSKTEDVISKKEMTLEEGLLGETTP